MLTRKIIMSYLKTKLPKVREEKKVKAWDDWRKWFLLILMVSIKKCQESTSPEFTMLVNDRFDFFVINDLISNAIKIDSGFVSYLSY